MAEPKLIETTPCPCGAKMLHFRFPDNGPEYWRCENAAKIEPDGTPLSGYCGAFGLTLEQANGARQLLNNEPVPERRARPEPADIRPCICGGEIVCFLENTVFPGAGPLVGSDLWICDCGAVGETYDEAISLQIPRDRVLH